MKRIKDKFIGFNVVKNVHYFIGLMIRVIPWFRPLRFHLLLRHKFVSIFSSLSFVDVEQPNAKLLVSLYIYNVSPPVFVGVSK